MQDIRARIAAKDPPDVQVIAVLQEALNDESLMPGQGATYQAPSALSGPRACAILYWAKVRGLISRSDRGGPAESRDRLRRVGESPLSMYEETGMGRVEAGVAGLAGPIAERLGLELVEVEYGRVAGSWQLRVILDKESGIGVEDCQRFSEELGRALDEADLVPEAYLLEVSSPGMERPLKREADFQRFAGKRIQIAMFAPVDGRKRLIGQLLGLVGGEVRVRLASGEEVGVPYTAVARARLAPKF